MEERETAEVRLDGKNPQEKKRKGGKRVDERKRQRGMGNECGRGVRHRS